MANSTERFTDRVENYSKYRPTYPAGVINLLKSECGLSPESDVADIGSGTGILAKLLLRNCKRVFGVEPNAAMRDAGKALLKNYPTFITVAGSAENTTLPDASIDLITAGQAFHWFDEMKARVEFKRILKSGGFVALVWNDRRLDSTPFLAAYEQLLREFGTDYAQVQDFDVANLLFERFHNSSTIG